MPAPSQTPGEFSFNDSPGGDLNLDDLFPNPEVQSQTTAAPETQTVASQVPPQAPPPPSEYLLETATGSKYRNLEDVKRGVEEKDAALERIRQFAIERTGIDPLTNRVVSQPAQTQPAAQPEQFDFQRYKKQTYDELAAAAERGDHNAYMDKLAEYNSTISAQTLSPYAPVLQNFARAQAIESVSNEIKDFRTFVHSDDYKSLLAENQDLAGAIHNAETVPQFYDRIPSLYKLAYYAAQGRRVPELVQQAARTAPVQTTPPPQTRPTMQSSSLAPSMTPQTPPSMNTSEGRKQLIKDAESRGVADFKW